MRTAITIAYRHGAEDGEILAGPAAKVGEQKDALKRLGASETHPDFRRVEVWESDHGLTMFRKFKAPGAASQESTPEPAATVATETEKAEEPAPTPAPSDESTPTKGKGRFALKS